MPQQLMLNSKTPAGRARNMDGPVPKRKEM